MPITLAQFWRSITPPDIVKKISRNKTTHKWALEEASGVPRFRKFSNWGGGCGGQSWAKWIAKCLKWKKKITLIKVQLSLWRKEENPLPPLTVAKDPLLIHGCVIKKSGYSGWISSDHCQRFVDINLWLSGSFVAVGRRWKWDHRMRFSLILLTWGEQLL